MPTASKRLVMVPVLSSAASIPLPWVTSSMAVLSSCCMFMDPPLPLFLLAQRITKFSCPAPEARGPVIPLPASRSLSFRGRALHFFYDGAPLVGEQLAQQLQMVGDWRGSPAHGHRLGPVSEFDEQATDGPGIEGFGCQQFFELREVIGDGLQPGIPGRLQLLLPTVYLRDRPLDRQAPHALVQGRRGRV